MRFRQLGTGWIQPYTIHPESTRSETAETASQSVRGMSETINRQKDSHMHTRLHTHAYTRIHTNGTRAHTLAESMAPAHSTTSPPARCCDEASAVCVCVCVCLCLCVCVSVCVCVCRFVLPRICLVTFVHMLWTFVKILPLRTGPLAGLQKLVITTHNQHLLKLFIQINGEMN